MMSEKAKVSSPALVGADTYQMLRRLFREHGRRHLGSYGLALVLLAAGAAATAYSAYLLKPVLNGLIEGERFRELRMMAWIVFGLFALRGITSYLATVVLARAGNSIVAAAQRQLFDNIVRQNLRFFS